MDVLSSIAEDAGIGMWCAIVFLGRGTPAAEWSARGFKPAGEVK